MNYRRIWLKGGTYFFTVNCLKRKNNTLLIDHIQTLRDAVSHVKKQRPFHIHAWVVLPDHMHCIWELPQNDADYATRWRLIKSRFSKSINKSEYINATRQKRNERGIWQRRYWAHLITDQADYNAHMNYVHINPLKHGLVSKVSDWPYSTFYKLVKMVFIPKTRLVVRRFDWTTMIRFRRITLCYYALLCWRYRQGMPALAGVYSASQSNAR